ncbi:MAG: dihydroneopterin aldolase [Alphaproteobacteria bacterium]|nr:dihydroneopterin aldolase [Alphaproteobacteria bacterium]
MKEAANVLPLRIADANAGIRHVFIRDLELEAHIGVHGHEKGKPQPVRINLDLTVAEDGTAIEDRLANVVDYEKVVRAIVAIIDNGHVNLVETLAELIAADCLMDTRIQAVRVRIEKLKAIPAARSVGVEIERRRETQ